MIRDYWVYQERQNELGQWALYIVKEFDRRKPDATTLDITYYSEGIQNAAHSKSTIGSHYDTVGGYVDEITSVLGEFSSITTQDKQQLEREILRILND